MIKFSRSLQFVLFSLLTVVAHMSFAQVSQVSASVDKNTALIDESIRLTVIAIGDAQRSDVDFSALQNDFRVSQPSFSQSTQIVNGNMSKTISWSVNLYPTATGRFEIPSFSVQGKQSQAFTIEVLPVDANNNSQPREFYVTATIDNDKIYLQQQILYKVQIHLARDIQRGQLRLPELEGAVIEQIGEDEDYQEIIDGVRYRIIERSYAIIPQASGEFTIAGPIFDAQVSTDSRRSFANFGRTTTISRRAPDINITVEAMPDNYSYTWLPSELVEVQEQWQGKAQEFVVGEPVTRTITLTALGLTKEQLPDISLPYHPSFKVYPEQAKLNTVEMNNSLIAQGVFNSAVIPEKVGNFVLPEVRIPWFNVKTGQTEFAIVPARSVKVVPSSDEPSQDIVNTDELEKPTQVPVSVVQGNETTQYSVLVYILIATNILTLIAMVLLIVKLRNKPQQTSLDAQHNEADVLNNMSEAQCFNHLIIELEEGKHSELSTALDAWLLRLLGKQHFSVSASLSHYPETRALSLYNSFLSNAFSGHHEKLDFGALISSLKHYRQLVLKNNSPHVLKDLYPKT